MKKYTRIFAAVIATLIISSGLSSCVDPYGKSSSNYYKKERAKYEVMDMHADCPGLIKR